MTEPGARTLTTPHLWINRFSTGFHSTFPQIPAAPGVSPRIAAEGVSNYGVALRLDQVPPN